MTDRVDSRFADLAQAWCEHLRIGATKPGGSTEFYVASPFVGEDGDALPIFLRQEKDRTWTLTDRGQTIAAYPDPDEFELTEARLSQVAGLVEAWGATMRRSTTIERNLLGMPTAEDLTDFIQLLAAVAATPDLLGQERAESFKSRATATIMSWLARPETLAHPWKPERDLLGHYRADAWAPRHGTDAGAAMFFVSGDGGADRTCVTILQYEEWSLPESRLVVLGTSQASAARTRLSDQAKRTGSLLIQLEAGTTEEVQDQVLPRLRQLGVDVLTR